MESTKAGLLYMASRSRNSYFTAYPNSPTPPRVGAGSFRPAWPTVGSEGTRWGERNTGPKIVEKIKRHSIVLAYIAIIVTIMLLMMLGVI